MTALVCFVPYRLKLQNFAYLQVVGLLLGDVGCYSIRPALTISPVPSTAVSSETVYESIAPVHRVHGLLRIFKNY